MLNSAEWRAHASQARSIAAGALRHGDESLAAYLIEQAGEMDRRAALAADRELAACCHGNVIRFRAGHVGSAAAEPVLAEDDGERTAAHRLVAHAIG